jgi:uncharacterized membrane protein
MGFMNRLVLLATFIVVAAVFAFNGTGNLPEKVAIQFDASGAANYWTSRDSYRFFLSLFLVGLPSLVVWLMAGLPRFTQGQGQIPNNEYWFAQQRRHATERFLIDHAFWLGCMTVAVVYGMHIFILRANANSPPLLAVDSVITMIAVYLLGLAWWFTAFMRHFQKIDTNH